MRIAAFVIAEDFSKIKLNPTFAFSSISICSAFMSQICRRVIKDKHQAKGKKRNKKNDNDPINLKLILTVNMTKVVIVNFLHNVTI